MSTLLWKKGKERKNGNAFAFAETAVETSPLWICFNKLLLKVMNVIKIEKPNKNIFVGLEAELCRSNLYLKNIRSKHIVPLWLMFAVFRQKQSETIKGTAFQLKQCS